MDCKYRNKTNNKIMACVLLIRKIIIAYDGLVVANILAYTIYLWVTTYVPTTFSKPSELTIIRIIGLVLLIATTSLYIFSLVAFYNKRYGLLCLVKLLFSFGSMFIDFFSFHLKGLISSWNNILIFIYFFHLVLGVIFMQIQRAEYIPKDDAIANGVISNSYYPPNGVYYQNYPIQGYGQPFVQPGGQPYYIQPGTMQQ